MSTDAAGSTGGRDELCLVTGATGFIGGRLAERLAGDGRAVRALARPSSDTTALSALPVEVVHGDITSPDSLWPALEGVSQVVHCAALVSDWATKREVLATNVIGTRNMAEAAARASVRRFVQLSSTDVYGYPGGPAVDERCPPRGFRNWYSQTKLEAEAEVRRAASQDGLETVILRPATVYGPGSHDVVGEIARAIRGRRMLLVGGGRAIAGLCYVENLADAVLLALEVEAARGQAFNVSDELAVTWRQFADDLARGLGAPPVRFSIPYPVASGLGFALEQAYRLARGATGVTMAPLLSRQAVQVLGIDQDFSAEHARQALGWEPRVSYEKGLAATLAWLALGEA